MDWNQENVLGKFKDTEDCWSKAWKQFLNSDLGKDKVPLWNSLLEDAKEYLAELDDSNDESGLDVDMETEENDQEGTGLPIYYMNNRFASDTLSVEMSQEISNENSLYWAKDRDFYRLFFTEDDIDRFGNWLQ